MISVLVLVSALSFGVGFSVNSTLDSKALYFVAGACGALILVCVLYLTPLEEMKRDDKYKVTSSNVTKFNLEAAMYSSLIFILS